MKVVIKEQEIELKKTMRSYMMFESITDKAFAPKNLTDMVTYFYCVVMSSHKGLELQFDEFIDWLDEHEEMIKQFTQWLTGVNEIEAGMTKKKRVAKKEKK